MSSEGSGASEEVQRYLRMLCGPKESAYVCTRMYWRWAIHCLVRGMCDAVGVAQPDLSCSLADQWCAVYIVSPYEERNTARAASPGSTRCGGGTCRSYHVLSHVEAMLCRFHAWRGLSSRATDVESSAMGEHEYEHLVLVLSVLFHDVVYDARRSDNEERSVRWFKQFIAYVASYVTLRTASTSALEADGHTSNNSRRMGANKGGEIQPLCGDGAVLLASPWLHRLECAVTEWVLATKSHLSAASLSGTLPASVLPNVPSLDLFLDLDLSVLGQTPFSAYRELYADRIKEEYSYLGERAYLRGRLKFLTESLLPHPRWFRTPYFHRLLERRARANVKEEAALLKAALGGSTVERSHI